MAKSYRVGFAPGELVYARARDYPRDWIDYPRFGGAGAIAI